MKEINLTNNNNLISELPLLFLGIMPIDNQMLIKSVANLSAILITNRYNYFDSMIKGTRCNRAPAGGGGQFNMQDYTNAINNLKIKPLITPSLISKFYPLIDEY